MTERVKDGGPAIELWRHSMGFQLATDLGGAGWRVFGPKFDGSSVLVKRRVLQECDLQELENFIASARKMLRARERQ